MGTGTGIHQDRPAWVAVLAGTVWLLVATLLPLATMAQPLPPPAGAESLASLLARVLPGDPQVRVARALLQATEERRLQARSRLLPTASLIAARGTAQEDEFGRTLERRTDRAEGALRWNVFNQGNDVAELEGSTREVAAAAEDLRRAREEVAERIADAYTELLRLDGLLPRAAERLATVRRLGQQVQRQAELGKASDADAQQAQASVLDAEIVYEQLLSDQDSGRARLAVLIGDEPRPVLPLELGNTLTQAALAQPLPGMVAAAKLRAAAARSRVRPVESVLGPRVDLEYRQRLSNRTRPAPTSEQQSGWLVTARWDLPLGGESLSRRDEVERRAEAAEAEAERTSQGVQAELMSLGPRKATAERAVAQLERQIEQYNALVRAGELQFEAGRRSLAQVVQLHDSRYNAEQHRAEQVQRRQRTQLRQLALTGTLLQALGLPGD